MTRARCILLAFGSLAAGCLRQTEFQCSSSTECGASGRCEPNGFCSVSDSMCPSGSRYSDTAGTYAGECVPDSNPMIDGGVDSPLTTDAMIDAPNVGCPGGYTAITGGQGTHRYMLVTATDDWMQQRTFCTATSASAYLAIPDDLGELQAIATLAATPRFWIGISDTISENVFLTVKAAAPAFLPWENGAPNDGPPPEDCVEAVTATSTLNDERCNLQQVAICECEP